MVRQAWRKIAAALWVTLVPVVMTLIVLVLLACQEQGQLYYSWTWDITVLLTALITAAVGRRVRDRKRQEGLRNE